MALDGRGSVSADCDEAGVEDEEEVLWFNICTGCQRWYENSALPCSSGLEACKNATLGKAGYVPGPASPEMDAFLQKAIDSNHAVIFTEADGNVEVLAIKETKIPQTLLKTLMGRCTTLKRIECTTGWATGKAELWMDRYARSCCGLNVQASQQVGVHMPGGALFGNVFFAPVGSVLHD